MKTRFLVLAMFLLSAVADASPTAIGYEPAPSLWWPSFVQLDNNDVLLHAPGMSDDEISYLNRSSALCVHHIDALRNRTDALERLLYGMLAISLMLGVVIAAVAKSAKSLRHDIEALNRQMNPPAPPQDGHPMRSSDALSDAVSVVSAVADEVTAPIKKSTPWEVVFVTTALAAVLVTGLVAFFCFFVGALVHTAWSLFQ